MFACMFKRKVCVCCTVILFDSVCASPAPGAIPQPLLIQLVVGQWGGSKASGEVAGRTGAPPKGEDFFFFFFLSPPNTELHCAKEVVLVNLHLKYESNIQVCVCVCFSGAIPAGSGEAGGRVAEGTTRCNGGVMQGVGGNFLWSLETFPSSCS